MDTTAARPGDRRAIVAVGVQFWINGMVYGAIVPRLPDVRDRLGIGVGTLGTILTLAAVGGLIGSAMSGPLLARFGTRRCIVAGTVSTVALLPFVGVTTSPVVLVLVLAGLGIFDVTIDIGMNLQGSILSARRSTPIMNRLHGLWSLGTVIGGLIAVQATAAGVSLLAHLLAVSAGLGLTVAVTGRFLLADDQPAQATGEARAGADGSVPSQEAAASGVGRIRLLLLALGASAVAMEVTSSDWAAFRLADDLGAGPGVVGLGFVAFTSGMVVGRLSGDAVQARVGDRALLRGASSVATVGLILATVVPFGRLFGVDDAAPVALGATIAGFFVAALGVSVIFPQLYDAAAKAPGRPGSGLAALTAGIRVAGVAAPIIVGLVADNAGSVGVAVALVTVPAALVTLLLAPRATPPSRPAPPAVSR